MNFFLLDFIKKNNYQYALDTLFLTAIVYVNNLLDFMMYQMGEEPNIFLLKFSRF
jgi:hypothetical protein